MFWGFKVRIYIMRVSVSMSMMYICMCVQLHEVCDVRLNMYMCMYILVKVLEKLFIMCICTCDVKVVPKSVRSISHGREVHTEHPDRPHAHEPPEVWFG